MHGVASPPDSACVRGSTSGLTRSQLRSRALRRTSRDAYVIDGEEPTRTEALTLLQELIPDGVFSGLTAATELDLPAPVEGRIELTRPADSTPSTRSRVWTHVQHLEGDHVVTLATGLVVTSGPRTFVDLARRLDLDELVVLGDAVARWDGLDELADAVRRADGQRGVIRARAALELVDPGSASPAETRTRLVCHRAGFTRLRHGVVIRDEHGQWLAEPDLADEEAKVALQYDGKVHFLDPARREADVVRDEEARLSGWEVVVLTARDDRNPGRLVFRVTAAYARALARERGTA